jgi:hypothetical protein
MDSKTPERPRFATIPRHALKISHSFSPTPFTQSDTSRQQI